MSDNLEQFVSFYSMPSEVSGTTTSIETAYLFYWYCPKSEAINDSLVLGALSVAVEKKFDLFNCLSVMGNPVDKLGFKQGTGWLNYFTFNWTVPKCKGSQVGLVLF